MKEILETIIKNKPNSISSKIFKVILQGDEPDYLISELSLKWSKSWVVKKFIEPDYINFIFDKHYKEIELYVKNGNNTEAFGNLIGIGDIKSSFVHFMIDYLIEHIEEDIFIFKIQKIIFDNPNTLTSEILTIILNNNHPKETFDELYEEKCYKWALMNTNNKDFYNNIFDKYYQEINDIINEQEFYWNDFDMSQLIDIKLDFVYGSIDYIIDWIYEDLIVLPKKDSRD